jgi:hypothetical protein
MFESIHPTNRALIVLAVLATTSLPNFAEKLIPAGTLIQCTVSENKLSSKTVAIGDPVLCNVNRSGVFPYGTVLSGTFKDYKDPGHLVGKGWMELVFDRMIFPSNDIVTVASKVIAVPRYSVDVEGKILGKGHDTHDTIEWLIPVLWPIDVINLPRRGPRPTLKNESRITIKVMDDMVIPDLAPTMHNSNGFAERPISYSAPVQQQQYQEQAGAPETRYTIVLKMGGYHLFVSEYWDAGHGKIGYPATIGHRMSLSATTTRSQAT